MIQILNGKQSISVSVAFFVVKTFIAHHKKGLEFCLIPLSMKYSHFFIIKLSFSLRNVASFDKMKQR